MSYLYKTKGTCSTMIEVELDEIGRASCRERV